MHIGRYGLGAIFGFCAALGLPERGAAQETAEELLQKAAAFYSGPETDAIAMRCARELLAEITVAHPASDLAVAIFLREPLEGVDVADIEARAGQIGTPAPSREIDGADPSALSTTDLGLAFAELYPAAFTEFCRRAAPDILQSIAADLGYTVLAYELRDLAPDFWAGTLDDLADRGLDDIGPEAVTEYVSEKAAVWLLDRYAAATGADVDSAALVEIASPTAQLIVAAATGSGPAAPALLAGTTAFSQARGAALSSYAEDERFSLATRGLISADAYRRAARELRLAGRSDDASEIEALAAAVVDQSAAAARASFEGSDGPLAEEMLQEMDAIVQLYRVADEAAALGRLRALQTRADEAAPGLFSLTTNNFYERYFMIGPQHAADSVRAYYRLHETLLEIFEQVPIMAAPGAGEAPAIAPLPTEPTPSEADPWQTLTGLYANDPDLRRNVAAAADYAVLAWAGYGDPEAVALADRLGWDMLENRVSGGTLATRFVHRDTGDAVVSFRGSLPAGQIPFRRDAFDDWLLTNVLGSFDPFELSTDQLSGAAELAWLMTANGEPVTFVGHSKGGRLAQIAHLETGQPAFGFNSAPLGLFELGRWPFASRAMAPNLQRFRAPGDLLTGPAALSATAYDDSHTVVNAAHGHAIDSLALAMLAVAELDPGPEARQAPEEVGDGPWGPDIVWTGWPAPGTCPRTDARNCLELNGAPEPALDFAFAVDRGSWGDVRAIEFRELGKIDLARLSVNYAPYEDTVLLNGSPDIIAPVLTRDARSAFPDTTSRRIYDSTPDPMLIYPMFTAYRLLPDGSQRFVQTESLMSGARAAGIFAGAAVTFLDFPPDGGAPLRKPVALSNVMGLDRQAMTAATVRANPADLQAALNGLGYDAGEVDGYPGPQTRTALMAFQADRCLPATGQPDPATIDALRTADPFAAPCPGRSPPPAVSATAPLLSGIYVDDPRLCTQGDVPFETVHLRQRIIRGETITWGIEGACTTRRTDIREGVTLFRGTCAEANQSNEARWRFDVLSNESFVDLDMFTAIPQDAAPRRFTRCPDDSALRTAFANRFGDAPSGPAVASAAEPGPETPERGTDLRRSILDAVRPGAEDIYGAPVEFVVDDMRVAGDLAFVSLRAQRPGGQPIDIRTTPGFRANRLWPAPGTPEEVQAVLSRSGDRWTLTSLVTQPTEAWWLSDCATWGVLFPETCAAAPGTSASGPGTHSEAGGDVAGGSVPGCVRVSPALSGSEIAAILNGRTVYGTNPETGVPWRWRFENVAAGATGRSGFSTGDAPQSAMPGEIRLEDARICETGPAGGGTHCETVHRCETDASVILFSSDAGDWSVAEAIYENAEDPLAWQHGSPSPVPAATPPGPAIASGDVETAFRNAASEAFGPAATVTLGTVHAADSVAFVSARVLPAEPESDAPRVFGQVVSTIVPVDRPEISTGDHAFEAILRRDGSVWRVAQSRIDPVANWWAPFCSGLEDSLGPSCSPTAAASASGFQWPEPPRVADVAAIASGDAELDAFLASVLPAWLVPAEVDYRIFPKDDGGRISVAGTLILTEPMVEIAPGLPTLRRAAREMGVVNDAFLFQALADLYDRPPPDRTHDGHMQEYRVVTPAGTEIPFDAELPYLETVRAKRISGELNYDPGRGTPLSAVPDHSFVAGDTHFRSVVNVAVSEASRNQDRAIERLEAFARHAPAGLVFSTAQGEPVFEISFDPAIPATERLGQMRWSGGRPFGMSHPGQFAVTWTGRVDVRRTINYSEPLVEGTSLRGAVSFHFTKDGLTLEQSSLTLFVNRSGGAMAVADGLRWDTELAGRGLFLERRITSIGMVAWPK